MKRVIVFSGAGLSADSGIPTFRDAGGLWQQYDVNEVCDFTTYKRNRVKSMEFFNRMRVMAAPYQPNAAHRMVAGWTRDFATVVTTQNVDDLLEQAGCPEVIHFHGILTKMKCLRIDCHHAWDIGHTEWPTDAPCPACGGIETVKPHVIYFGEMAPQYERLWDLLESLTPDDTVVVIGTSCEVLDVTGALTARPGFKILCNLEPSDHDRDDIYDRTFYLPAAEAAPQIDALVRERLS